MEHRQRKQRKILRVILIQQAEGVAANPPQKGARMYKTYIITYWTGEGKKAEYKIEAQFEQDARDAFFWDVELEDAESEIISIVQEGE